MFEAANKEELKEELWRVADYCGVEILAYSVMSNHFHVLVKVPQKTEVGDEELLRRYGVLYGKTTSAQRRRLAMLESMLKSGQGGPWRARQLRQMGDVSEYMKLVKQRYTQRYNREHQRYGPLWAERFKSVLVEDGHALKVVCEYIGQNSVKAGLAAESWEYAYSSHGEAQQGSQRAVRGLEQSSEGYRGLGKVSAGILGTEAYVRVQAQKLRVLEGRKRAWTPVEMAQVGLSALSKGRL